MQLVATQDSEHDLPVAQLDCPACQMPLTQTRRIIDRIPTLECWDEYVCEACGLGFDYRHNTAELRRC